MKEVYQDRIEKYLLNRMSYEERLTFESDLEKNEVLRTQFEFTKTVQIALMLENIEKDVHEWDKEYKKRKIAENTSQVEGGGATGSGYDYYVSRDNQTKCPICQSKINSIYWISGIAATVILGIFLFKSVEFYNAGSSLSNNAVFDSKPQGSIIDGESGLNYDIDKLLAMGDFKSALSQIEKAENEISSQLSFLEREKESICMNKGSKTEPKNRNRNGKETLDSGNLRSVIAQKERELEVKRKSKNSNVDNAELDAIFVKQKQLKDEQKELSWLKVHVLIRLNRLEEAVLLLDEMRHAEGDYKYQADSLYRLLMRKR